jgi:ectoine hydroxylase-related dioxygenase (phytanoyl-CoA dioxygenase family)
MLPLGSGRRAKRQREADALAEELRGAGGACAVLGDAGRAALREALRSGLAAAVAADTAADAAAAEPPPADADAALTRVALCVVLQPLPGAGGADWAALRRSARAVAWPERSLRWTPGAGAELPNPPRLALCCSLLAAGGGDDAAAEDSLLRRLRAALGARAAPAIALAAAAPIPLLPRPAAALTSEAADAAAAAATLRCAGVALLTAAAGPGDVAKLAAAAASRLAAAEVALAAAEVRPFRDEFAHADAASRGTGRLELRLPLEGPVASLAFSGPCAALARAALHDAAPFVSASVVVSRPGAAEQQWHADGPHLVPPCADPWADEAGACDPECDAELFAPSVPPHAVCVFVALCHVTPALGPTHFWLGSHGGAGLVELAGAALGGGAGGARLAESAAVLRPCLRSGDAAAYDYRTLHRGGANAGGAERPLLQLVYRRATPPVPSWDEGNNFGAMPLLGDAPEGGWAQQLQAGPAEEAEAAAGAAAWAKAEAARALPICKPAPPVAAPPAAPVASGWSVFD